MWRAFDLDAAIMSLDHSIDHGQPQASAAALDFGGEEGFQTMLADFLIHADAVVPYLDLKLPLRAPLVPSGPRAERVRRVMTPPWGSASTALKTTLVSASRSSLGLHTSAGKLGSNSNLM